MTPERNNMLQNAFIFLVAGMVITPAFGFATGYWVLSNTVEQKTQQALLNERTDICVAQFKSAPDYQSKLKAFKAMDYSAKGTFLDKGGWTTMPGDKEPSSQLSTACGDALSKL